MCGTKNTIIQLWKLKQLVLNRVAVNCCSIYICTHASGSDCVLNVMEGRNKANFFSEVLLQTHLVIDILAKVTEGLLVH